VAGPYPAGSPYALEVRAFVPKSGATDEDPLFTHPRQPGRRSTERLLRELIRRSCHKLGIDPPWMHGGDCRYGADAGLIRRRYGWMIERGLALLTSNPEHPVQFPQPPCIAPPGRVRPHRTQCDQR